MNKDCYRSSLRTGAVFLILNIFVFLLTTNLPAQENKKIYHPLSGSVLLSLEYSETISQTDYPSSNLSYGWRGYGEYFLPLYNNIFAGVRIYGGTGYLTGKKDSFLKAGLPPEFKTTILYIGEGVELGYKIGDNFYPYIFGGATSLFFDPRDPNGHKLPNNAKRLYSKSSFNGNLELGLRYFFTDEFAADISFTQNFNSNDYLDDLKKGSNDTYSQINIGVSYALFASKDSDHDGVEDSHDKCPNTPEGVRVDASGCPLDSDGDGVPDYMDKCPNTPKGVVVDIHGCPLDSDSDGVPDYLDKCPGTPKGVKVDSTGCPLDSDGDGVPDYLDKCPNTPKGVKVDSIGCPLDSDGDGVPDYLDKCSNTPKGVKVDSAGCPLDSDGDGVPDYTDKCPNTPKGVKVDSTGCPLDSDGDGVPDYKDQCPNTPHGVKVDSLGCPLDSDGDGVPDYLDKCPHTPHGVKVNSRGCPVKGGQIEKPIKPKITLPEKKAPVKVAQPSSSNKFVIPSSTIFVTRSAIISSSAFSELNKIVSIIKSDSSTKWRIEGFTDFNNAAPFNQTLSFNRANAIYIYFLEKGIDRNRFDVIGEGKYLPYDSSNAKSKNVGVIISKIQ